MFKYRKLERWKYQLTDGYTYDTGIYLLDSIKTEYVSLVSGKIIFKSRYAWDGASGGIDTPSIRRASLVHDGLCQLIEMGKLSMSKRREADHIFKDICRKDGMSWVRTQYTYLAIRAYVKIKYGWKY